MKSYLFNKLTTVFLVLIGVMLSALFPLGAQTIQSEGKNYQYLPNTYAILISNPNYFKTNNGLLNNKQVKISGQSAGSSDVFIKRLANYQIYQGNQGQLSLKKTNQVRNQNTTQSKYQVLKNLQTNKIAIVQGIFIKYKDKKSLLTLIRANSAILRLANEFKRIKLALILPNPKSQLSVIDLYLYLQKSISQAKIIGVERLSLTVLENPMVPQ